jgi:hypothetical protein
MPPAAHAHRGTEATEADDASAPWMPSTRPKTPSALHVIAHSAARLPARFPAGTQVRTAAAAITPMGTLTAKIDGQPHAPTRRPPSRGPATAAAPPTAPQMPRAIARRGGRNSERMIVRHCGVIRAAPTPCSTRHPISSVTESAVAHSSDPIVNAARPTR